MGWFGSGSQNRVGIIFSAKGYKDFSSHAIEMSGDIIGILKDEGYGQYGSSFRVENFMGVNPGMTDRWSLMIQPSGDLVHLHTFTYFGRDTSTLAISFCPDKDNKNPDRERFDHLINAVEGVMETKEPSCEVKRVLEKVDRQRLPSIYEYVPTGKGPKR